MEISKKFKTSFDVFNYDSIVKISSLYHFEKMTLKFSKIDFLTLKIQKSQKCIFSQQLDEGCVQIWKLYYFFWRSYVRQK